MRNFHLKHRNILFLTIGIILPIILFLNRDLQNILVGLGSFGYLGAFVAGVLFISTFTYATGVIILLNIASKLSIVEALAFGVLGAIIGDLLIFCFVRKEVEKEIEPVYKDFEKKHHLKRILHTRYFAWTLPVLGAFIIASPLPDELGISLMGISKLKNYQFAIISLLSHGLGMFLVLSVSALVV